VAIYFPPLYVQTFSEEPVGCIVVTEAKNSMSYALASTASINLFDPACFDQGTAWEIVVVLDNSKGTL
jgi:hypothetical protein